jgi:uncharacterized protein YdhG (YjbR/CyaY superfamily)
MASRQPPSVDVDRYVAAFPIEVQRQLQKVRRTIRATAPAAQEVISYGMPAYRMNDLGLLSMAGWKKHIALYPAPSGSARFNSQLQPYRGAKSTVRLPLDRPMPVDLIVQIVKLRIKDNLKRAREKERKVRK